MVDQGLKYANGVTLSPDARATVRAIERDAGWRLEADVTGLAPAGIDRGRGEWDSGETPHHPFPATSRSRGVT